MDSLNDILAGRFEGPCLSLYQPTHRAHPENRQDPIRFRNLVRVLEASLRTKYPDRDAAALLAPFNALAIDERFWNHTLDALAVLGAPGVFRVYRLQRPAGELAVVADSFHVKPRTASDALGEERKQAHTGVWTYHAGVGGAAAGAGVHHGQGGEKAPEVERDTERFFRAADRAILERHSRPSRLPLLLAALPQHHGVFRKLSRNPFLLVDGIDAHPDALSPQELRERAWRILEPHYLARLAGLVEMYGAASARELGTDDLEEAAAGAAGGRVATLLIQAERRAPEIDDRLDDMGEDALRNGGQVIVVPAARMPTRTGIAAIYRY